jgi:uncharacterized membrane protein
MSFLSIISHLTFYTNAWDLGIYSQALYTTLRYGKILHYTAELPGNPSGSLFGIHFCPFLFFLIPLYALYQNPVVLLIVRPLAISIGLIPLYWILLELELNNKGTICLFSLAYLVYPPLVAPFTNFDIECFLPSLFLFALYFLMKEKKLYSYIFIILALMVNEFVSLIVVSFALYLFILYRREVISDFRNRRLGRNTVFCILLLLTGILWFNIALFVISYFNPQALTTKWEWGEFGTSPGEIIFNVLKNPFKISVVLLNDGQKKFLYIMSLLAPVGFLSLLDPLPLIMTLPWLIASLLSINPLYYSIGTHYPAFVAPFIFFSAVKGVRGLVNMGGKNLMKIAVLMICICLSLSLLLLPRSTEYFEMSKCDEIIRFALNEIPEGASASVMPEVFPHICNRLYAYPYFRSDVDYILINVYSWWYTVLLPRPAHIAPRWCDADITEDYKILINAYGVILYKRGYRGQPIFFRGIEFEYTASDVRIESGSMVEESCFIDTRSSIRVLLHRASEPARTFFEVPSKALPPGSYDIALTLKISSPTSDPVLILEVIDEIKYRSIDVLRVYGNDLQEAGEWQTLNLSFKVSSPVIAKMVAYSSNSTDVYFCSMKVTQVSG